MKKLRLRAANSLAGLSERDILGITSVQKKYRMFNAKFLNKPKPRPVIVKDVQKQHPIDLVDLSSMRITFKGKVYRYIFIVDGYILEVPLTVSIGKQASISDCMSLEKPWSSLVLIFMYQVIL